MACEIFHKDLTGAELHVSGYFQASDPGAIGAGKGWIDTSAGTGNWVLKIRNSANTGWETVSSTSSDILVKISANDTTAGYLNGKLIAGSGITLTENNDGSNETLSISLYLSPTVTLSGGSTNEVGSTIVDVALSWTCNKSMTTRTLSAPVPIGDRDRGAGQNGSYTHSGANLTSNTTYTITVGDGTNTANSSSIVYFRNRRYYGTNINTSLTNGEILAFSKEYCSARANTHTYNCTGGTYIWICYPASFGLATFTVGGLETTFTLTTQSVTNDSGYTESFYCYRSTELQNGSDISVVVT